jgi:hypothetical protein
MAGDMEKVAALEGQVTDLEKQVNDLIKELEAAVADKPELAKALEMQSQVSDLIGKTEQLTSALETTLTEKAALESEVKLLKEMSDDERNYCKNMSSEEKGKFWAKDPEERKKEMGKRAADDETITVEGQEIRKSAVGETQFKIMKAQAERIAKSERQIADEIAKRELAELAKRADDDFAHVPGTSAERAQMLQVMSKMDEPLRKSFETVLTQAEKLAKAGFDKLGHKGGKDDLSDVVKKAARDFESKVTEIRNMEKCSRNEAAVKARKAHPDLFKAYQEVEAAAN